MIKSVCCICGVQYGEKPSDEPSGSSGVQISHGYCHRCMLAELEKIEAYADEVRP